MDINHVWGLFLQFHLIFINTNMLKLLVNCIHYMMGKTFLKCTHTMLWTALVFIQNINTQMAPQQWKTNTSLEDKKHRQWPPTSRTEIDTERMSIWIHHDKNLTNYNLCRKLVFLAEVSNVSYWNIWTCNRSLQHLFHFYWRINGKKIMSCNIQ
jgi:hypothetical protein